MTTQKEVFDIINGLYHIKDDKNIIWFYAKELCTYLEYEGLTRQIIKDNIKDESQKIEYSKLKKCFVGLKPTKQIHHRELFINEDALYELILQSKKPNAEKFKKWAFKVISKIRKGEIKEIDSDYKAPTTFDDNGYIIHFDKSTCDDKNNMFYDKNDEDMQILKDIAEPIDYKYYFKKNVLYCFATSMIHYDNETQKYSNKLLIKMGYSKHFDKRCEQHISYYGCEFKLIAIQEVNDEDDEKTFHKHIQLKYPELYHKFGIRDGKGKIAYATEFYKFDYALLEEFFNFDIELKTYHKPITELEFENNKVLLELQHAKNRELELKIEYYKLINRFQ